LGWRQQPQELSDIGAGSSKGGVDRVAGEVFQAAAVHAA